jgi:hypothetical protein
LALAAKAHGRRAMSTGFHPRSIRSVCGESGRPAGKPQASTEAPRSVSGKRERPSTFT